ncbi:MAG: SCO family protein [Sulfuritalea sp.]|jgi:protein SCO1/2|nr:SCO family protein [Polynucleobacter sp.]MCF8187780.1 SCO family protein [Sulfuritalea sp.]
MRHFLLWLCCVLALTACEKPQSPKVPFANTDITGLDYAKGFTLTDHNGKPRTLADFKGKVVVVFFGYTQCPDVCPTTLSELAGIKKALGSEAERLQVIFITLDPQRDTPELMAGFVPAFDSSFLGLWGEQAVIDKVAKDFKVFAQKVPSNDSKSYTIDHTAGSYVFDDQGHIRLFVRHGQGVDGLQKDLQRLLAGSAT